MEAETANTQEQVQEQVQEQPQVQEQIRLVDVQVTDENIALNLLVTFISVAHKRGAFALDESAKIWECISKFNNKPN